VNNGVCGFTGTDRCKVVYKVRDYVRRPTDSKNGSDSYPHQNDSLVHAKDAPCIERDIKIRLR